MYLGHFLTRYNEHETEVVILECKRVSLELERW